MSLRLLWICLILLTGSGASKEVPIIFEEIQGNLVDDPSAQFSQSSILSSELAGVPILTQADDDDLLVFPVTGGGNNAEGTAEMKLRELKRIFDERVDINNSSVVNKAAQLAAKYPGDRTIDQVCSIYNYIKNGDGSIIGWRYVGDPRGLDYYRYASESLKIGREDGYSGIGDCDDFAILMVALIESVGGTTRIILAQNNTTGGHAYAEVYLGCLGDQDNYVEEIIKWLEKKYNTNEIYTHIDTETKDVWLNLDWGDLSGNAHPGGPFFKGSKHILLSIRDNIQKASLYPTQDIDIIPDVTATKPVAAEEEAGSGKDNTAAKVPSTENRSINEWIDNELINKEERDDNKAISSFDEGTSLDPQNYQAWQEKALSLSEMGEYDEALECMDKAIAIDSSRDDLWANKGKILYTIGRYQEAAECFDRAIQIKPCGSYWSQKGEALIAIGRRDLASDAFSNAQTNKNC